MDSIIKTLRQRIGKGDHELFGFTDERNCLKKCIESAYKDSISDSILIIGKKGTGKTHLMRSVLKDLDSDDNFKKTMSTVHLNGLIQTDDKMAIKSIGQQLKVSFEDDENEILSSQRINDTLQHILKVMSAGHGANFSLLFIIEEFDLFLKNRSQMLVYNLVNCVHSTGTSICVVGITSRLDVVELMEKRVISRFSRCHIHLTTHTHDFDLYMATARQLLTLTATDNKLKVVTNKWNKSLNVFLNDNTVLRILEQMFLLSNTISKLKLILFIPICRLSESQTSLQVQDLEESWRRISVDYKIEMLKGLSEEEFIFTVVMVMCAKMKDDEINFEMVYRDYKTFHHNRGVALEKNAMKKCLNNLVQLQLVGLKKVANVSVNYQQINCYVQHWDLKYMINCREMATYVMQYIQPM